MKYSLCCLATTNKHDKGHILYFFFPISVEFYYINDYLQINYVPSTELNLPIIPGSAYASALKEYEDINKTDSEGDGW